MNRVSKDDEGVMRRLRTAMGLAGWLVPHLEGTGGRGRVGGGPGQGGKLATGIV